MNLSLNGDPLQRYKKINFEVLDWILFHTAGCRQQANRRLPSKPATRGHKAAVRIGRVASAYASPRCSRDYSSAAPVALPTSKASHYSPPLYMCIYCNICCCNCYCCCTTICFIVWCSGIVWRLPLIVQLVECLYYKRPAGRLAGSPVAPTALWLFDLLVAWLSGDWAAESLTVL